ncbi:hypothetical protein ONZ45_g9362 [Pleurotus djamor]|nr:hypothetical protein ONZ45_g9362 [Pleurotus djamor]
MSVIAELPCNVPEGSSLLLQPSDIPAEVIVHYAEFRFIQAIHTLYAGSHASALNVVLVRELEYVLALVGMNHAQGRYLKVGPATSALSKGMHLMRTPNIDMHTLLTSLTARTERSGISPRQHAVPWWLDCEVEKDAISEVDLPSSLHRLSGKTASFCVTVWFHSLNASLSPLELRETPWENEEMSRMITVSGMIDSVAYDEVETYAGDCQRCDLMRLRLSELAAESLIIEHHVANSAEALARSADGYYRLVEWLQTYPTTVEAGSLPVPALEDVIACLAIRAQSSDIGLSPISALRGLTPPSPPSQGVQPFYWPSRGLLSASLYPILETSSDDIGQSLSEPSTRGGQRNSAEEGEVNPPSLLFGTSGEGTNAPVAGLPPPASSHQGMQFRLATYH